VCVKKSKRNGDTIGNTRVAFYLQSESVFSLMMDYLIPNMHRFCNNIQSRRTDNTLCFFDNVRDQNNAVHTRPNRYYAKK
jgi:hypothetical protein